ncbi:uncharacterized protein KY384_007969 [Bacidia gigantensis]|uniref:uncharacterized protein n=1 Tax=Bacidia gigantensis TaxID=2732470 RepID=UPI001D04A8EA|nr:uncharacterized protein KY384_007969 [Bacidia gigantensis]KAG8527815.1 hypothetical protein KY384_007969 [Bacidia gigantensis]
MSACAVEYIVYPELTADTTVLDAADKHFIDTIGAANIEAIWENAISAVRKASRAQDNKTELHWPSTNQSEARPLQASDPALKVQNNAPRHLGLLSWPKYTSIWKLKFPYKYMYRSTPLDTYLYVIEEGVDIVHEDFNGISIEWHYSPNAVQSQSDNDPDGHGTCVASLAAGKDSGVIKERRTLVVMKSTLSAADILDAFSKTLEDMVAKNRQKKTVVIFASGSDGSIEHMSPFTPDKFMWERVRLIVQDLIRYGAVIVTAAGNGGHQRKFIDETPAVWSLWDYPKNEKIISATAVNEDGEPADFAQIGNKPGEDRVFWAPGENVQCASARSKGSKPVDGTSFSTGLIAAEWWIQFMRRAGTRAIKDTSGTKMIWNGEDGSDAAFGNDTYVD